MVIEEEEVELVLMAMVGVVIEEEEGVELV